MPPAWLDAAAARDYVQDILKCDLNTVRSVFEDHGFCNELKYHFLSDYLCGNEDRFCTDATAAIEFLLKDAEVVSYLLRWLYTKESS